MQLNNIDTLFSNKNKNEQEQIRQERQFAKDIEVSNNATHPQNTDETLWLQRQENLNEIRMWLLDQSPKFMKAFEELSAHRITQNGVLEPIGMGITPLCSINGAYHLINYVKKFDHHVSRSCYSEPRILLNLRIIGKSIISFIKNNRGALGIEKNFGTLNYITWHLYDLIEPTYFHALNDGERKHESQIHKIVETKTVIPREEKKGFFKGG